MMDELLDGGLLTERDYIESKKELVDAWDKTPFLREADDIVPLKGDYQAAVMAQIFENYKREANAGGWRNLSPVDAIVASQKLFEASTPTKTTAWSGATNLPLVLGYVRKMMPKVFGLELIQVQALDRPSGRVFYLNRIRHDDGTDDTNVEIRGGWSYRSWIDDPGEATDIVKTVKMTLTSDDVSATSHKLKAETSIEFEQDLRAYHNMDGRAVLAEAATDEFAMELSERILWRLWNGGSASTLVQYGSNPDTTAYSANAWAARMLEAYNRADGIAFNKNRTRCNWAVVGNEHQIQLGILNATEAASNIGQWPVGDGMLQRLGTLNNRWRCYVSALPWPENDALLGYVGESWTDAIMFYLPYVPLMVAGTHFNPTDQTWTISWLARDCFYLPTNSTNGLAMVRVATAISGISYPALTEWSG